MELKALSRLGWSVSALAREYGLSRATIYRELASPSPRHYERAKPTALSEPQLIHIERRVGCTNCAGWCGHVDPWPLIKRRSARACTREADRQAWHDM